jgi:hypothetical protein
MRTLLFILFVLVTSTCRGQLTDTAVVDWRKIKFTHAKAYLYGIEEQTTEYIITNGKLHASVVNPSGTPLSKEQVEKVIKVAMREIGKESDIAFCFVPHHGIVFYNGEKPVSHISICFDCGRRVEVPSARSIKDELSSERGLDVLKEIIVELGLPVLKGEEEYYKYSQSLKSKKN